MQSKQHMKEFVINLLNSSLSPFYYYHNYEHTLYVLDQALEIGQQENCGGREIKLLTAGALWHDTGYIKTYNDHEEAGCELAGSYLPGFGYSMDEIEIVKGMIMATKIPQSPKNKLEKIIADADLEYLGTADAAIWADRLYREWHALNTALTEEEWNRMQISFLDQHTYFTQYCKENKDPLKLAYLNKLKQHK